MIDIVWWRYWPWHWPGDTSNERKTDQGLNKYRSGRHSRNKLQVRETLAAFKRADVEWNQCVWGDSQTETVSTDWLRDTRVSGIHDDTDQSGAGLNPPSITTSMRHHCLMAQNYSFYGEIANAFPVVFFFCESKEMRDTYMNCCIMKSVIYELKILNSLIMLLSSKTLDRSVIF